MMRCQGQTGSLPHYPNMPFFLSLLHRSAALFNASHQRPVNVLFRALLNKGHLPNSAIIQSLIICYIWVYIIRSVIVLNWSLIISAPLYGFNSTLLEIVVNCKFGKYSLIITFTKLEICGGVGICRDHAICPYVLIYFIFCCVCDSSCCQIVGNAWIPNTISRQRKPLWIHRYQVTPVPLSRLQVRIELDTRAKIKHSNEQAGKNEACTQSVQVQLISSNVAT